MSKSLRIAHLSDPHFGEVTFSLSQFLSKRWLGNTNLLLFRRKAYSTKHLFELPSFLDSLQVKAVCITGDFASTSLDEEFASAKELVGQFKAPVFYVPGNHDAYTKLSLETKRFYDFLPEKDLQETRVSTKRMGEGWWWVGLDCAVSTPVFHSYGLFFETMEKKLVQALDEIPKDDHIILGNHFPLFDTGKRSHNLKRKEVLQSLLMKYPNVKLYLHGHDHRPYVIDRTVENLPLVLNSGSIAPKKHGMFSILDLDEKGCTLKRYYLDPLKSGFHWNIIQEKHYEF